MTSMELLELLGSVPDEYVLEAHDGCSGKRARLRKSVLLAAVIALFLLLVGCTAAYVLRTPEWGHWFSDFFSGKEEVTTALTENQRSILDHGLVDIQQSVTEQGFTITLESGISDGRRAFLKFRMDAPEDTDLTAGDYSLVIDTNFEMPDGEEGDISASYHGGEVLDEDPTDSSIVFLEEFLFQPPSGTDFSLSDGSTWNIEVKEITLYRTEPTESIEVICEGNWDFTLKFSDDALVTESTELLQKPARCNATRWLGKHKLRTKVTLTSIELRTLSATVTVKKPLTGFWDGMRLDPIYLVLNDGTRVLAKFRMAVFRDGSMECMYLFDRPISIYDVAYVDIPS